MNIYLHFFLLGCCFLLVAFFAGIETGVLCVSRMRLIHLVRNGVRAAKTLSFFVTHIQRFIATVLVGCNLFNVILSVLSASLATRLFPQNNGLQTAWAMVVASSLRNICRNSSFRPVRYGARFWSSLFLMCFRSSSIRSRRLSSSSLNW
jgi:CBS domain containing-hemolysin-like protein